MEWIQFIMSHPDLDELNLYGITKLLDKTFVYNGGVCVFFDLIGVL
jgi:hypothetical protein